jgi:hypothetical protein
VCFWCNSCARGSQNVIITSTEEEEEEDDEEEKAVQMRLYHVAEMTNDRLPLQDWRSRELVTESKLYPALIKLFWTTETPWETTAQIYLYTRMQLRKAPSAKLGDFAQSARGVGSTR